MIKLNLDCKKLSEVKLPPPYDGKWYGFSMEKPIMGCTELGNQYPIVIAYWANQRFYTQFGEQITFDVGVEYFEIPQPDEFVPRPGKFEFKTTEIAAEPANRICLWGNDNIFVHEYFIDGTARPLTVLYKGHVYGFLREDVSADFSVIYHYKTL